MILVHIIQKLGPGVPAPPPGLAPFGIMDLHRIEPLRIRVRKRLHHDVIDHAENRRGRPNPQRQRKYRDRRKSRRLPQVPRGIPNILPQRFHMHPPVRSTPASINPFSYQSHSGGFKPRPYLRGGRNLSRRVGSPALFRLLCCRVFRPVLSSLSFTHSSQLSSTPPTTKSRPSSRSRTFWQRRMMNQPLVYILFSSSLENL